MAQRLPRLLRAAGFELAGSFAHVVSEIGTADVWESAIGVYRSLLPQAGLVTEAEADAWAEQLRHDSEAGVFFASCNYYAYIVTRTERRATSDERRATALPVGVRTTIGSLPWLSSARRRPVSAARPA